MLRVLAKPLDSSSEDGEDDLYAFSDDGQEGDREMEMDAETEEDAEAEASYKEGGEDGNSSSKEDVEEKPAALPTDDGKIEEDGESEEGESSDEEAMSGADGCTRRLEAGHTLSPSHAACVLHSLFFPYMTPFLGPADEAMFHMDAKLASYFSVLKEGKGSDGSARTARHELINFKMRVAALMEVFCKRVGGLRHVLVMVVFWGGERRCMSGHLLCIAALSDAVELEGMLAGRASKGGAQA